MLYIPEGWTLEAGGRTPEKPYVWSIICTLEPQWIGENMAQLIHDAFDADDLYVGCDQFGAPVSDPC